jgi:hypothetical protein
MSKKVRNTNTVINYVDSIANGQVRKLSLLRGSLQVSGSWALTGNLDIVGGLTLDGAAVGGSTAVTGAGDFFTTNRLDSQGVLLNSSGTLILSSSTTSIVSLSSSLDFSETDKAYHLRAVNSHLIISSSVGSVVRVSGNLVAASLTGGFGSGDTLGLTSTSNATKGKILFGANSAYDEANTRLGIGNISPAVPLHVQNAAEGAYFQGYVGANARISLSSVNSPSNMGVLATWNGLHLMLKPNSGKVGIHTADTTPANALDVYGALAVGSSYYATAAPSNGAIIQGNVGIGNNNPGSDALSATATGTGHGVKGTGGTSAGSHAGVYGLGTTGHGVIAESDTTSPARAALRIVPQDTDPATSPAAGDIYVNISGSRIRTYDGTTWNRYVPQCYASTANDTRTSTGQFANAKYVIPADTLGAGSVIRWRFWGKAAQVSIPGGTNTINLRVGGSNVGRITGAATIGTRYFRAAGMVVIRGNGATAGTTYSSEGYYWHALGAAPATEYFYDFESNTVDTDNTVTIDLDCTAIASFTTLTIHALVIDIS